MSKLTYQQIRSAMETLSDRSLKALAKGPLPEVEGSREETCRVCSVFEPLARAGTANQLVMEMLDWHDFVSQGYGLIGQVLRGEFEQSIENSLVEEVQGLVGDLSYARCSIVYACAEAELERRRRSYVQDGLDIDGEPPDDRTPEERRQDEEAEDAERRLDAEKVGDL